MKLSEVTLYQLKSISERIVKNKFTVKYWFDMADEISLELDLNQIDARALVRSAMTCKSAFRQIEDSITFSIKDAEATNRTLSDIKEQGK